MRIYNFMFIKFKNKIILYIRNNSRLEKINYIGYTIINYSLSLFELTFPNLIF